MIINPTLILLAIYAVAMGLLEAAVVVYMRRLYYPDDPLSIFPMRFLDKYDSMIELSRETATIAMLVAVALMVERSTRTRSFAAFVFIFGIWDLCYYAWLKILIDWPRTWLEWDVLFLIPVVWLSPWICPAMISILFIAWGYLTLRSNAQVTFSSASLTVFVLGCTFSLVAFFQPALGLIASGKTEELNHFVPSIFWWWLFIPSFAMMAYGLGMTLRVLKM